MIALCKWLEDVVWITQEIQNFFRLPYVEMGKCNECNTVNHHVNNLMQTIYKMDQQELSIICAIMG